MAGINTIRTIQDLERETYGNFEGYGLLKSAGIESGIHAAHDTGAAASSGALYNQIYGQKVWSMLNREINALSMLAKKPWSSSGWRVLVERALGGGADVWSTTGGTGHGSLTEANIGGVTENASFTSGATDALSPLKPVFDTLFASPKTIAHQFEISELAAAMAKIDDGIGDIMSAYREEIGVAHAESMNHMLLQPLENMYTGTGTVVPSIANNLTSLYKIVSSDAELTNATNGSSNLTTLQGVATGASELWDLYGKDRNGTAAWMDSYVNYGDYTSTRRNLTVNMLNTALRELQIRGGSPKVILTGYDTVQALGELLQAQERYMGRAEIMPSHNGVKGVKGREVGFKVATYHDIPIIPCKEMGSTGSGSGLSDMFILDTDHLFFCTLKPTEYFEGGIDSGDPFGVGKLGNRGMYRTIGETVCTFFKGQGKITNIQ